MLKILPRESPKEEVIKLGFKNSSLSLEHHALFIVPLKDRLSKNFIAHFI